MSIITYEDIVEEGFNVIVEQLDKIIELLEKLSKDKNEV